MNQDNKVAEELKDNRLYQSMKVDYLDASSMEELETKIGHKIEEKTTFRKFILICLMTGLKSIL